MKTIALIVAWTWIALPLAWGVYQSVQKSMPLFDGQSPTTKATVCFPSDSNSDRRLLAALPVFIRGSALPSVGELLGGS